MANNLKIDIEVIIKEYSNYVFKIVDNTIGNSLSYEDKEEIVSDSFYLLWKNQDKIKENLKSYLSVIAKNCAYQKVNKEKNYLHLDDCNFTYKENYHNHILLDDLLKKLTKDEKNIFNLHYINGYKVKEIAKYTNKSVTSIKVILYRIRKKLREGAEDV